MASSKISEKISIIANFHTDNTDAVLMSVNKVAIITGTAYSGENGFNQYFQFIYVGIPSNYRPNKTIRVLIIASNGTSYGAQITTSGSVQTTSAIPANLTLTFYAAWGY